MKTVYIFLLLVIANASQAAQVLKCETFPQHGSAILAVYPVQNQEIRIVMKWRPTDRKSVV